MRLSVLHTFGSRKERYPSLISRATGKRRPCTAVCTHRSIASSRAVSAPSNLTSDVCPPPSTSRRIGRVPARQMTVPEPEHHAERNSAPWAQVFSPKPSSRTSATAGCGASASSEVATTCGALHVGMAALLAVSSTMRWSAGTCAGPSSCARCIARTMRSEKKHEPKLMINAREVKP
jgi:hypothetical protein